MILIFCAVNLRHRQVLILKIVFSSQISLCVVLFKTAPYRVYRFVGEQTEQKGTPQFRELALLFCKSPNDDFGTFCGVKLHGLHKAWFSLPIFTAAPERHIGEKVKSAVRTVQYVQHFFTSLTISVMVSLPAPRYPQTHALAFLRRRCCWWLLRCKGVHSVQARN